MVGDRRLAEKGGSLYVCIPKRMVKALGWKAGDRLRVVSNESLGLCIVAVGAIGALSRGNGLLPELR
jgi:antitoxin component of MazEF toxin-antitoxin module